MEAWSPIKYYQLAKLRTACRKKKPYSLGSTGPLISSKNKSRICFLNQVNLEPKFSASQLPNMSSEMGVLNPDVYSV